MYRAVFRSISDANPSLKVMSRRRTYQTACRGVMRSVSPTVFRSRHSAMRPTIFALWLYEMALWTSFGERRFVSLSHRLASPLSEFARTTSVQQQLLNCVQIAGFINGIIAYIL